MDRRRLIAISVGIVAAMALVGGWAWLQLPADAVLPVHWGIGGEPDGFADKTIALFGLPLVALALTALFAILPSIEPRRRHLEQSGRGYRAVWLGVIVLLGALQLGLVAAGLDETIEIARLVVIGVGVLFVVIGNYLPTVRSNWFIGIRTPWTLSSERSWERTHRLGGRLFVAAGVVFIVAGLLGLGGQGTVATIMAGVAVLVVLLVAYSYVAWRSDPDRQTGGSEAR